MYCIYQNNAYLYIMKQLKNKIMKATSFKTISRRTLKVSANQSKRTYTIKTESATYRTIKLSKEEFEECWYNTGNDWQNFLRGADYYKVR